MPNRNLDAAIKKAEEALASFDASAQIVGVGDCLLALRSLLAALRGPATADPEIDAAKARVARAYDRLAEDIEAERVRLRYRCEQAPASCPTCRSIARVWDNPEDAVYDAPADNCGALRRVEQP